MVHGCSPEPEGSGVQGVLSRGQPAVGRAYGLMCSPRDEKCQGAREGDPQFRSTSPPPRVVLRCDDEYPPLSAIAGARGGLRSSGVHAESAHISISVSAAKARPWHESRNQGRGIPRLLSHVARPGPFAADAVAATPWAWLDVPPPPVVLLPRAGLSVAARPVRAAARPVWAAAVRLLRRPCPGGRSPASPGLCAGRGWCAS